jgi:protein phosphatase 2C-like protein
MWRFAAARATGTSHLKTGSPCQDRFSCAILNEGTLVAAVADGAGSAPLADQGAEIAVETVVRRVSANVQRQRADFAAILVEAAAEARQAVLAAASEQGTEARALASTLLATIAGPDGGAALQIGDGVIVVSDGEGWRWVFWPQRGEYANTTHFLTDEDAPSVLQVVALPKEVTDMALMTDGLEPLALHYAIRSVHEPFFYGIFDPLFRAEGHEEITSLSAALESFLSSQRIASRTDDDVSLVVATRRPQPSRL